MKSKNIVVAFLLLLAGVLASCEKESQSPDRNPCIIDRPQNLQSIDWENYNDVYTVYWTYYRRERNELLPEDTTKIIKVYGWIAQDNELYRRMYNADFTLIGNETGEDTPFVPFIIVGDSEVVDAIKAKLATADPMKKCYVRGKLCFSLGFCIDGEDFGCCLIYPRMRVYSANDVYFE